jgi:hypothetical protein
MFEKRNISEEEALKRACKQNGFEFVPNNNKYDFKMTNENMLFTDDGWKTSKSGIGIYKNNDAVDFTDDEFRGMLGYIIGYTSEEISDDYKELRESLVNEVLHMTGKDLTKCWIWM